MLFFIFKFKCFINWHRDENHAVQVPQRALYRINKFVWMKLNKFFGTQNIQNFKSFNPIRFNAHIIKRKQKQTDKLNSFSILRHWALPNIIIFVGILVNFIFIYSNKCRINRKLVYSIRFVFGFRNHWSGFECYCYFECRVVHF